MPFSVIPGSKSDATTTLFKLLSEGECGPEALTRGVWTISTYPVATHGELTLGDQLVFIEKDSGKGISRKADFDIWKNGKPWISQEGWGGSCVRDGNQAVYVVTGTIDLDGCPHELAIGRLDHTDALSGRIEIVFQDQEADDAFCTHYGPRHPGHAHGDNN
jgi:hypothetical protein